MAPLLPSSRCVRQDSPFPGILQAVEGHKPFPHLPSAPHLHLLWEDQCLDSRGGLTVTAGKAKDFMESQQSRRNKEQAVDREEKNRWEYKENLRKPRCAQSMLEEDVASGEPARTQQSRKSMILKQRHWIFSFPAAPAPQRRARMSETLLEIQAEALQSACSACKTLGSRAGTWL